MSKGFLQILLTVRLPAGVAEVVKGAGLKIRSRMGSWVRIPPPAPIHFLFPPRRGGFGEQPMQNRLTLGGTGRDGEQGVLSTFNFRESTFANATCCPHGRLSTANVRPS